MLLDYYMLDSVDTQNDTGSFTHKISHKNVHLFKFMQQVLIPVADIK